MANISNLPQAIREPDVRITGTSYPAGAVNADIINTPAYLLSALRNFRVIGEQVRLVTNINSTPPIQVPTAAAVPTSGGSAMTDSPYGIDASNIVDLKLIAAAAALPLNMQRTINDSKFNVVDFYKTFLADAIRAEIERQLIVGDGTGDTFVGLLNQSKQSDTSSGGTPRARNAEIDEAADQCVRGRGMCRADLIVCNREARRKMMADFMDQNRGWEDVFLPSLGMNISLVCLAQGWTPLVVSDFIETIGVDTNIYFLVTEGENACVWGTPRGMENIKYSTVRGQVTPEDWMIGESLGALLVQDDQKISVLTSYDVTI